MFEGTGKYFLMFFIVLFIVYMTVKICLGKLFKAVKIPAWKAYVPFYNRLILVNLLDIKKSVFYKTLIPFANLYYYNIIIKELLKAYKLDPKESILFILVPMYKFPELVFKRPKFMLHMYDDTEEFISNQNILFETTPEEQTQNISMAPVQDINQIPNQPKNPVPTPSEVNGVVINPAVYNQMDNTVQEEPPINISPQVTEESVFSNNALEPDERHETVIEAKQEVKQEAKPINVDNSKPKVCPNCGTKLSPTATTCFLCGTKIL